MPPAEPGSSSESNVGGGSGPAARLATEHSIRAWLAPRLAELAGIAPDAVDPTAPFSSFGVDSAAAAELLAGLEVELGRELDPTVVFSFESPAELAAHLASGGGAGGRPRVSVAPTTRRADRSREPVAVVGIGCRLPGASGPEAYWALLRDGVDAVSDVPEGRWDDHDVPADLPAHVRRGGFVDELDQFDPGFFGISQLEADRMDPQQRMLLEVTWEALEDADIVPSSLRGTPVGVFVGISANEYGRRQGADPSLIDVFFGTGNALSIAANRVSYALDLRGPSVAVDTACSSSLVALHQACAALHRGECTTAVAGGANAILTPLLTINFSDAGVIAPDGRCKTFDASADGIVRGEGAAMVVLKPLSRAVADGDRVYCVLEGSAVNQDGRSNGLTAPNPEAQIEVFGAACADAGVDPATVGYIEAHGTGTVLGDAMELRSLDAVYGDGRSPDAPLLVGSVKTNIGHLESAAGVAGLVKTALALHHGQVPPTLHFRAPNPYLGGDAAIRVAAELQPWPGDGTARAAVSGFGFGGTNAHLIVGPAPDGGHGPAHPHPADGTVVLPLSARSRSSLAASAAVVADRLERDPEVLADLAAAEALTREHHPRRLAVVGTDPQDAVAALRAVSDGKAHRSAVVGDRRSAERSRVIFVCSGQGRAWWPFDGELLADPVIRPVLEQCDAEMRDLAGWSVMDILRSGEPVMDHGQAQPLLYTLQVALAARWRAFGVEPDLVLGQSIGELAAAQIAGAIRLAEGLEIVLNRGRYMQESNGIGHTGFVELPADELAALISELGADVTIAAVTAPDNCLVSGPKPDTRAVVEAAAARGVMAQIYTLGDIPGHGPLMTPYAEKLTASIDFLEPRPGRVPIISTVTGEVIDGTELDASYWGRNLRQAVRLTDAMATAVREGAELFVEIAAHPVVGVSMKRCLEALGSKAVVQHTVKQGEPGAAALRRSVAAAWTAGADVDWRSVTGRTRAAVEAPRYPWDHRRCWFEAPGRDGEQERERRAHRWHPALGEPVELADAAGTTSWPVEVPATGRDAVDGAVLSPGLVLELATAAVRRLTGSEGAELTEVELGADVGATAVGTSVQLTVSREGQDRFRWQLGSAGTAPRLFARGHARALDVDVAPLLTRADLAPAGPRLAGDELADPAESPSPALRVVDSAVVGDDLAVAELRPAATAATASWTLHPDLFDGAVAAAGLLGPEAGGDATLRALARAVVRRPWGAPARAVVRRATGDVTVVDEWGAPVVELAGARSGRDDVAPGVGAILVERWDEAPPPGGPATVPRRWCCIGTVGDPLVEAVTGTLGAEACTAETLPVWLGEVSPDRPGGIVVFDAPPDGESVEATTVDPLDAVVDTLAADGAEARLYLVTRAGRPIGDGARVTATGAATVAAVPTAATRAPRCRPTSVDVSADGAEVEALVAELLADADADAVVLRGERREVGALVEEPVPGPTRHRESAGDAPHALCWTDAGTLEAVPVPEGTDEGPDAVRITTDLVVLGAAETGTPLVGATAGVAAVGRLASDDGEPSGPLVAVIHAGAASTRLAVGPSEVLELPEGVTADVAGAALARLEAATGGLPDALRRDPGLVEASFLGLLAGEDRHGPAPVEAAAVLGTRPEGATAVRLGDPRTTVTHVAARWTARPGSVHLVLDGSTATRPELVGFLTAYLQRRGAARVVTVRHGAGVTTPETGPEADEVAVDLRDPAAVTAAVEAAGPELDGVVCVLGDVAGLPTSLDAATADRTLSLWLALGDAAAPLGDGATDAVARGDASAAVARRRAAGLRATTISIDSSSQGAAAGRGTVLDRLLVSGASGVCWAPGARAAVAASGAVDAPWFAALADVADDAAAGSVAAVLAATAPGRLVDVVASLLSVEVARILGIDPDELDPDTTVSDYGVDSLVGMELRSRIEDDYDYLVPLSELSRTMTVRQLATHLASEAVPRLVRRRGRPATGSPDPGRVRAEPVRTGTGPPTFWVPGIFGSPEVFTPLADDLDGVEMWAFRAPGTAGGAAVASVDALAEAYVGAVRDRQGDGPYRLGGYSFGALVAARMAALLERSGEQVERLWLLDPPPPEDAPGQDRAARATEMLCEHLNDLFFNEPASGSPLQLAELPPLGPGADLGPLVARITRDASTALGPDQVRDVLTGLWSVAGATVTAMAQHRVSHPVAAPVTLVRATQGRTFGPTDGSDDPWLAHLEGPTEVVTIDADHVGLLRPPHVTGLAAVVRRSLDHGAAPARPQQGTTMTSTDTTAGDITQSSPRAATRFALQLAEHPRVRNAVGRAGNAYRVADFFLRALGAERRFRRNCTAGEGLIVGDHAQIVNLTGDPGRIRMGHHCLIDGYLNVQEYAYFSMGSYCGIGTGVRIDCSGYVEIGNGCTMAEGVYVVDGLHHPILTGERIQHGIDLFEGDHVMDAYGPGTETSFVRIEDLVWIGLRAVVLSGVTIGRGSVISAGAVVSSDVPPFSVVAGNPGRVVGRIPAEDVDIERHPAYLARRGSEPLPDSRRDPHQVLAEIAAKVAARPGR